MALLLFLIEWDAVGFWDGVMKFCFFKDFR